MWENFPKKNCYPCPLFPFLNTPILNEFPKFRASRGFAPYVPSRLTSFTNNLVLRALLALLARLTDTPCAPFSCALSALFVRLLIFLGWICSPAETFYFSKNIKGTTNRAVFMRVKKHLWYFLSIFITWSQFNVLLFFFSSLQS